MSVSIDGAFIYFTIPLFGGINITQTTVSSFLVLVIFSIACIVLGRKLTKRPGKAQVLLEKGISMMQNMVVSTMGAHNVHWTPFILTIFASSVGGSLIGLTGFLRSSTADLSCTLTWAVMVSVIIWYNNIKNNGFVGWLKGFTEPVVVMTPMNLVSEVAQPFSMAFRHFGNVAGGGVITTILYTAFSALSALVLNLIASSGWAVGIVLIVVGVALFVLGMKKHRMLVDILGILSFGLGLFGILQGMGVLSNVPVLALGIPAIISVYFDVFSGFVQAYVFSLLTMVYIAGSCPEPEPEQ